MGMTLDELRAEYGGHVARGLTDLDTTIAAHVESPIEALMLWALICEGGGDWYDAIPGVPCSTMFLGGDPDSHSLIVFPTAMPFFTMKLKSESPLLGVQPVVRVGDARYRPDIALHLRYDPGYEWSLSHVFIDIECDGHDFHERTKEQAESDKRRDRDLQSIGWTIARFTGSEIVRDPQAAARSVFQLGNSLLDVRIAALKDALRSGRENR